MICMNLFADIYHAEFLVTEKMVVLDNMQILCSYFNLIGFQIPSFSHSLLPPGGSFSRKIRISLITRALLFLLNKVV